MPTLASARYPKPTSWDEFEAICQSSFKTRWNSPNLQRHGRPGQAQQGVDIYGDDNFTAHVGIQCKNTVHGLASKLINTEIANAEKYSTPLQSLYIATTADTDAKLQAYARRVSLARRHAGKFTLDIVFWDAIVHDLTGNAVELAKHYPQFLSPSHGATSATTPPRQRDVETLNQLLAVIDIDATKSYLEYAPKYVHMSFLDHTENFMRVVGSPTFHVYAPTLKACLDAWLGDWVRLANLIRACSAYHLPLGGGGTLVFRMPGDSIRDPGHRQSHDSIEKAIPLFFGSQQSFCNHVREHYSEVDMARTSRAARELY